MIDQLEIITRVNMILGAKRLGQNDLARMTSIPPASVCQYLANNRKMPANFLISILYAFPDISAEWLIRGEGEMNKADNIKSSVIIGDITDGNASVNSPIQVVPNVLEKVYQEQIEFLRGQVEFMQEQLKHRR